jgi:outer membrane biosynthesis protein TonB
MRSDYGLYGVAIVCFVVTIIAGAFTANLVSGYTLEYQSGIAVMLIFLLIGIISAIAGYSSRPKVAIPTAQPRPTPVTQPRETLTQPIAEETPLPPPPIQTPQEEVEPEPQPPAQPEPSPPAAPVSMEAEQPVAAEEEKPKPTRRRRKKAIA